jgi:hypothetical protein
MQRGRRPGLVDVPALGPAVLAVAFSGFDGDRTAVPIGAWTVAAADELGAARLAVVALDLVVAESIPIEPAVRARLQEHAFAETVRTTRRTAGLQRAQRLLDDRGIRSVGIKGVAMLCVDDPRANGRCFADVDIVVARGDFPAAVDVLVADGMQSGQAKYPTAELRAWWPAVNLSGADDYEVDVHRSISPAALTRGLDFDALWRTGQPGPLPGTTVVSPAANLLVVAASVLADAQTERAKVVAWRDLALLLAVADVDAIEALAAASQTTWLLALVIDALVRFDAALVPGRLAALHAPTARVTERLRLRALGSPMVRRRAIIAATWPPLPAAAFGALWARRAVAGATKRGGVR